MAKVYSYRDVFSCPHVNEKWHKKALKLVEAIEKTPSKRVADLMKQDLEELISVKNHNPGA